MFIPLVVGDLKGGFSADKSEFGKALAQLMNASGGSGVASNDNDGGTPFC